MNNFEINNAIIGGGTFSNLSEKNKGKFLDNIGQQTKDDSAIKKQKVSQGWLGCLFGSKSNSIYNVTCLFLLICIGGAFVYTAFMLYFNYEKTHNQVIDFWKIISPLITLALGYLFGVKNDKND